MKADTIMAVLLKVMEAAAKSSTVLEDAFLTVGAVTAAVEGDFVRYMERFTPILYQALANHEEHQVSVGVVAPSHSTPDKYALSRCAVSPLESLVTFAARSMKTSNRTATRS
jgi:importin subunit beta-1